MVLPSPNLDDRRFQQLVDEAKRYVQQRTPEWTDHNVSDPGVTLIETFAHMVDQLVYRLNRVPDRNYLAFLDLLGVGLFPPAAARAEVTFWLSAEQPETVLLPAGTEVATEDTNSDDAVVFGTVTDLPLVPCELSRLVSVSAAGDQADRTNDLNAGRDVRCFQTRPAPGDVLMFGLSAAVPRCVVAIRLDSQVEGIGVDPRQPPLVWEAWNGADWTICDTYEDTTGGLNRPGDVVLLLPPTHALSVVGGARAGWLRCRVVAPIEDQPFYSESPTIRVAEASTIGGVCTVEHAETVVDATLGVSAGVPGQRFRLATVPVLVDAEPIVVQVSGEQGWQEWTVVEHFGESRPADRHVTLDPTTGEFCFPPAVRESDGTLRAYGATPPKQARLRVPRYRTGGGRAGNVSRGTISVLRSSVPYVARVENREAAGGGVDGETVDEAKVRAPHQLRVQERAVTATDYEQIARQAAPAAARVRCLPLDAEPGAARVLVVPDAVADEGDRIRFEQLIPPEGMLAAITERLDERRLLGTRILVEPPFYQGVTVVARLVAAEPDVDKTAVDALYRHLSPLRGGIAGTGWPFGLSLHFGEVFAILQRVPGVTSIEEVRLFPADPITGRRGGATDRIDLAEHALLFSFQHQVLVS
ncbi:putative baseplate assembly protein [Solihabitans fulvus]|uniref:Putative baseplate assembly protein n=1 Tax=Solihabitans fulvus TaxID=1892852 RepID=A0A5B2X4K8_9PSEU|nr:putative baseplate assembly protein [Solihabitans fulvus]KAA2258090.1 putative baseplate assembly protein [Solihabitans fulvus]